jgi:phospholipase/carboxylesterase
MNRLTSTPAYVPGDSSPPQRLTAADRFSTSAEPSALAYHLTAPIHYEPNYAYPLLVWLHGAGDDQRQLRRIMPHVSLRNYVAVGPRGVVAESNGCSYRWPSEENSADASWSAVQESIEIACTQYNVDSNRIFLAGLNDGGTMAMRLALSQPERFAGAASIGGVFPQNCAALSRLNLLRDLPLLIMRGLESTDYPEERLCEELRLFHAARMQVHVRQYTCGDDLMEPMLRDLDLWLMERVTGMPVLSETDAAVS